MAASRKMDIIFLIVTALAIFLLVYIASNIINTITDSKDVIKLIATIILPVPLSLFANFIAIPTQKTDQPLNRKDILISVFVFLSSAVCIILFIVLFENLTSKVFEEHVILPSLINSLVIFLYALNYITINNLKVAGFLGGILFGLAFFIFLV